MHVPPRQKDEDFEQQYISKLRSHLAANKNPRVWTCCNLNTEAQGCTENAHVFKIKDQNSLEFIEPFLSADSSSKNPKAQKLIALDCEMVYTDYGLELAHLVVLDNAGKVLLNEKCKLKNRIVDYNTTYSGLTNFYGVIFTLKDVRQRLLDLINDETIIVGHGLENDFVALRLLHFKVIDTCILFPHPSATLNRKFRFGLKKLAQSILGEAIQESANGHDPTQDALTCLKLVEYKLKGGLIA